MGGVKICSIRHGYDGQMLTGLIPRVLKQMHKNRRNFVDQKFRPGNWEQGQKSVECLLQFFDVFSFIDGFPGF